MCDTRISRGLWLQQKPFVKRFRGLKFLRTVLLLPFGAVLCWHTQLPRNSPSHRCVRCAFQCHRSTPSEAECELRMVLAQVVQRALRQKLFGGWSGTVSARISAGNGSGMLAMLISPANTDRQDFTPDAFVAVECLEESGSEKVLHEPGKIPSVGVKIHEGDLQDASRCELCDCIGCSSQCKWHSEQHHPQQDHNSTQR